MSGPDLPSGWTVVVALRSLPTAKGRLAADLDPPAHRSLVEAIRADTLAAVRAADGVARVVVVADEADPGVDVVQSRPGLNGALLDADEFARTRWPGDAVAALVGDLPALRSTELAAALAAASSHAAGFVADASGSGTTVLTAGRGVPLRPGFGIGSAARHRSFAVDLPAGDGLRHDVDTLTDLATAEPLGLGPATAAWIAQHGTVRRSS